MNTETRLHELGTTSRRSSPQTCNGARLAFFRQARAAAACDRGSPPGGAGGWQRASRR